MLTGLQYTPAMLAFKDMGFLPYEHHSPLYGLLKPAIEWRDHIDDLLSDPTAEIWGSGLSIFGDGTQDIVAEVQGCESRIKEFAAY